MFKNLGLSILMAIGLFFILTGSEKQANECTIDEVQECWIYDSQKGWIYQAPPITIAPMDSSGSWSFDEEKGWIYQAVEITIIG